MSEVEMKFEDVVLGNEYLAVNEEMIPPQIRVRVEHPLNFIDRILFVDGDEGFYATLLEGVDGDGEELSGETGVVKLSELRELS